MIQTLCKAKQTGCNRGAEYGKKDALLRKSTKENQIVRAKNVILSSAPEITRAHNFS